VRCLQVLRAVVAAVVVIASAPAHGSPLEPLWEVKQACNWSSVVAWGDVLVMRVGTHLVPLDRATGAAGAPISLAGGAEAGWLAPVRSAADRIVLGNGAWFGLADRTGTVLWTGQRHPEDGTEPVLHAAAGDLIVGRALPDDAGLGVARHDGATGIVKWQAATAPGPIATAAFVDDGTRLYAIALPRYYADKYVVSAFDLATGKRLWQTELRTGQPNGVIGPVPAQHAAAAAGRLFVAVPSGVFAFDPATGQPTDLQILGVRPFEQTIAVRGTRVYVARDTGVTAVDATTHKVMWSAELRAPLLGAATDEAVYAIDDTEVLFALDARTGANVGRYGLGAVPVAYAATDARNPLHIACNGDRMTAFGTAAAGPPVEQATITGRLLCRGCGKHGGPAPLADVEVAAGGASVRTDRTGAFELDVAGRGTLPVTFALGAAPEPFSGWREPTVVVKLRGKARYALGSIGVKAVGQELP
jgi:outer membrane protein assembly factor BamB